MRRFNFSKKYRKTKDQADQEAHTPCYDGASWMIHKKKGAGCDKIRERTQSIPSHVSLYWTGTRWYSHVCGLLRDRRAHVFIVPQWKTERLGARLPLALSFPQARITVHKIACSIIWFVQRIRIPFTGRCITYQVCIYFDQILRYLRIEAISVVGKIYP